MSITRRAGAEVVKVIESSSDPAAVAGVAQVYSKDDGGSAELFSRSGNGTIYQLTPTSAGGGDVLSEIWAPRITPHLADDEFDTNALDADWAQTGFTALNFGTRPAPYAVPVVNAASWENIRDPDNTTDPTQNTWLRIQPAAGLGGIWKRLDTADFGGVTPTNLLAWARFRFGWRNASGVGGGDADIGMSFFDESGAGFSFATHATINLNNTQEGAVANVIKPLFWCRNGAVVSNVSEGLKMNATTSNRSQYSFYSGYVGLQKAGANEARAWLLDDGGNLYMGDYNNAGLTMNAVAIWCRANSAGGMGVPFFDIDFVRFYEGVDWIP